MATRATLLAELEARLADSTNVIWTEAELKGYIDHAISGLYPSFYRRRVATTIAAEGPMQTLPGDCRNLYMVGLQRAGSTRVRSMRRWAEGDGNALVPKTGIADQTLVWAWTSGWPAPATDAEVLGIPLEAQEVVVIRAQITALEKLLVDRVSAERFLAVQVRQGADEDDINQTIDALHISLRARLERTVPLPEVQS